MEINRKTINHVDLLREPALWKVIADEMSRLQAIVAALSKCNRLVDGKLVQDCLIRLTMTVWWKGRDGICNGMVTIIGRNKEGDSVFTDTGAAVATEDCCNTREAAEAMAAKKGGG